MIFVPENILFAFGEDKMKFIFFIVAVLIIGYVALKGAGNRVEKRKEFWQVLRDEVEKDDSKKSKQ